MFENYRYMFESFKWGKVRAVNFRIQKIAMYPAGYRALSNL